MKMTPNEVTNMKMMVLDGNSIVNRAFYGVKPLSTRDGLYTNAIFGFLNILQKLMEEDKPDGLCITFDQKAPTFRHLAFSDYKAQRKGMPEELAMQLPVLKEVLSAMNIPMYAMDGWEADDLMGTISRQCEASGWDCTLVTGDKDSLQLVTEHTHVKLVVSRMGQTTTREMTPDLFREEYGFDPIHLIDLKALMGDSSDNYPGVPGIGEKTAMTLIQTYGSVENLYANFDTAELKPAQRRKLDEGRESARLCYDLATIRTDAPMNFAPQDNLVQEWNKPALYQLFLRLEFQKLITRYGLEPGTPAEPLKEEEIIFETVTDPARLEELLTLWQQEEYVYFLALPTLDGVAVEWGDHAAFVYAPNVGEGYDRFLDLFFSGAVKKISHDVKPLMNHLLGEGLSTDGFVFDTALAAYLLSPTDGSYELDKLFVSYYNCEIQPQVDYTEEDAFSPLGNAPMAEASLLAHVAAVAALHETLKPKLEETGMLSLLTELELPLCPVLAEMERAGVLVDRQALADFGVMLDKGIRTSQGEIYRYAGHEFNINSPKQLGVVLFEELDLPALKKTKTGYSTNAEILEKLRHRHPIVQEVLDYRQLAKLKSTYVDGLLKVIAPDGRIHTSFQNTVTATGRLSSTEPNLQNIPVRTPLGAEMRKMFIAAPGNVLVDADYSQIELRLLAHIADDKEMQEGFRSGVDIHTITASQVFGVPVELVTKSMRSSSKAVNFGIVYGISEFSLAQDIGVSRNEAKAYMERYFEKYSGVRSYMNRIVAQAKEDGYVSTVMGRRRPLPEINSSNFNQRSFGERVALNAPIQGTAADIIKLAMIRVQNRLKAQGLTGRLVLQVHDELIVECPQEESAQVAAILKEEMEQVASLSVPLQADAKVGSCWADAH
jgi:DNA polymerase-1